MEQSFQKELIESINQKRKIQNRVIEEIEQLKFKQDVKTGLTYFDLVKEQSLVN